MGCVKNGRNRLPRVAVLLNLHRFNRMKVVSILEWGQREWQCQKARPGHCPLANIGRARAALDLDLTLTHANRDIC